MNRLARLTKVQVLGIVVALVVVAVFGLSLAVYNAATTAVDVAHQVCETRNASIVVSNARWALEREAWKTAAHARAVSAAHETGTQRRTDLDASRTYLRVANAITPYQPTDCGG